MKNNNEHRNLSNGTIFFPSFNNDNYLRRPYLIIGRLFEDYLCLSITTNTPKYGTAIKKSTTNGLSSDSYIRYSTLMTIGHNYVDRVIGFVDDFEIVDSCLAHLIPALADTLVIPDKPITVPAPKKVQPPAHKTLGPKKFSIKLPSTPPPPKRQKSPPPAPKKKAVDRVPWTRLIETHLLDPNGQGWIESPPTTNKKKKASYQASMHVAAKSMGYQIETYTSASNTIVGIIPSLKRNK